jgi:hypothetical protein
MRGRRWVWLLIPVLPGMLSLPLSALMSRSTRRNGRKSVSAPTIEAKPVSQLNHQSESFSPATPFRFTGAATAEDGALVTR